MNENRPSWWRFFAWTVIGTAIVVSVLGAMTIGIFILPFAILGVILMAKRNSALYPRIQPVAISHCRCNVGNSGSDPFYPISN